jgi:sodium/hydrogen antiporter
MLAVMRIVRDIRTYRQALFCGNFGPMGLGALFLAMEARAQLETGTSLSASSTATPQAAVF